jgi:hypothetical protein
MGAKLTTPCTLPAPRASWGRRGGEIVSATGTTGGSLVLGRRVGVAVGVDRANVDAVERAGQAGDLGRLARLPSRVDRAVALDVDAGVQLALEGPLGSTFVGAMKLLFSEENMSVSVVPVRDAESMLGSARVPLYGTLAGSLGSDGCPVPGNSSPISLKPSPSVSASSGLPWRSWWRARTPRAPR